MEEQEKKSEYSIPVELQETEQRLAAESVGRVGDGFLLLGDQISGGELAERKRRGEAADKKIREIVGDRRYDDFKAVNAANQSKSDESFMRMFMAKMSHAKRAARESEDDASCSEVVQEHCNASASAMAEQGSASEAVTQNMMNQTDAIKTAEDKAIHDIDADESLSDEQKSDAKEAIRASSAVDNAAIAGVNMAQLNEIGQIRGKESLRQAASLRDTVLKCYKREYDFSMGETKNHLVSHANAMATARKFAVKYFKERIARGNNQEVMQILDYLQSDADAKFKASKKLVVDEKTGKPILDKDGKEQYKHDFDPSNMLFCRYEDFRDFKDAVITNLSKARERENRDIELAEKQMKREAAVVKNGATLFALGINPETNKPFTGSDDRNAYEQRLIAAVGNLQNRGYTKAGELLRYVNNQPKIEFARQQRFVNFVAKQQAKKNLAAMENSIYNEILKLSSSENMKYVEEVELEDANGKLVKTPVELDAARGICTLIDEAQLNGLCKGEFFTNMRKRFDGAEKNRKIVENVLNKILKYPTVGTQKRMKKDGEIDWGNRPESEGEYIMLKLGENATFNVANVGSGNKVIAQEGVSRWFGKSTPELAIDSDTLKVVANLGRRYLEREMENATETGLIDVMSAALERAKQKGGQKSFGMDFVKHLEGQLNARYFSQPAIQSPLNPYVVTPAIAGKPDFDKIRNVLPLISAMRTKQAKNDIMLASQPDEDAVKLEALFGGESDEEE